MSHELDMSNGRVNFAYTGEDAWHGLGNKLEAGADIETWRQAAGMSWSALKTPIFYQVGEKMHKAPNQYMIIRDDTLAPLGSFTDRYKIVQPDEVLSFFRDFILTDERFSLETAGCLRGGGVIWALAKFQDRMTIVGEEHAPYVMLTTSYDGTRATTAQATMIRVVCKNTMNASIYDKRSATVRVRHSTVWSEKVANEAHEQLTEIAGSFDRYKDMAEAMSKIRLAKHQTEEFFKALVLGKTDQDEAKARKLNQIDALMAAYGITVNEGTTRDTAWTALNAVTRYVDHDRSTRRTNGDSLDNSRFNSAMFGTGAAMKQEAINRLLELAE